MDDEGIIELFFARSEQALKETGAKYGAYCRAIARNILSNKEDEEECVNDALFGLWNSIPPARPNSLQAFFGKITRNTALNRIKKRTAEKRKGGEYAIALDELSEVIGAGNPVEESFDAAELSQLIDKFLGTLPSDKRAVFVGRYWYFDPVKTVARKMGFSVSKTKMILLRTRNELKAFLEKEDIIL